MSIGRLTSVRSNPAMREAFDAWTRAADAYRAAVQLAKPEASGLSVALLEAHLMRAYATYRSTPCWIADEGER